MLVTYGFRITSQIFRTDPEPLLTMCLNDLIKIGGMECLCLRLHDYIECTHGHAVCMLNYIYVFSIQDSRYTAMHVLPGIWQQVFRCNMSNLHLRPSRLIADYADASNPTESWELYWDIVPGLGLPIMHGAIRPNVSASSWLTISKIP